MFLVAVSMANSPGLTRMVQPRVLPTAGGIPRPGAPDKPSVIVVQKGQGGKAVYTKVIRLIRVKLEL